MNPNPLDPSLCLPFPRDETYNGDTCWTSFATPPLCSQDEFNDSSVVRKPLLLSKLEERWKLLPAIPVCPTEENWIGCDTLLLSSLYVFWRICYSYC